MGAGHCQKEMSMAGKYMRISRFTRSNQKKENPQRNHKLYFNSFTMKKIKGKCGRPEHLAS